jgi:hypothetical protein
MRKKKANSHARVYIHTHLSSHIHIHTETPGETPGETEEDIDIMGNGETTTVDSDKQKSDEGEDTEDGDETMSGKEASETVVEEPQQKEQQEVEEKQTYSDLEKKLAEVTARLKQAEIVINRGTRIRSSTRDWMLEVDMKKQDTAPKLYAFALPLYVYCPHFTHIYMSLSTVCQHITYYVNIYT